MATVSEKLTTIADNIRTMTNTTAPMGLDAMAGHVADANTELSEQDVLVEELLAALEGKSVSGGSGEDITAETAEYTAQLDELESTIDSLPDAGSGGGTGSVETCTVVVVNNTSDYIEEVWCTTYDAGTITTYANNLSDGSSETFTNILKGSVFIIGGITTGYSSYTANPSVGITAADYNNQALVVNLHNVADDTITITIN